jgi:hypothetical protein
MDKEVHDPEDAPTNPGSRRPADTEIRILTEGENTVKAEQLKAGILVQLDNGATARVMGKPTNLQVRVKYLDSPFDPDLVGKEGMCSVDEITGHYVGDNLTTTAGQLG